MIFTEKEPYLITLSLILLRKKGIMFPFLKKEPNDSLAIIAVNG